MKKLKSALSTTTIYRLRCRVDRKISQKALTTIFICFCLSGNKKQPFHDVLLSSNPFDVGWCIFSLQVYIFCRENTVFALAPHVYTLTQLAFYYFTYKMKKWSK